jgi:tripartite ATP-independent transporter DctP family solute receptor
MNRRRFAVGAAATFAGIAVIRSAARAAQFQYKYANPVPADHPLNLRMRECWDAVRRETGGRLDVQIFPNGELGGDTSLLAQVRSGALEFFTLDGGILQSVVPAAAIQSVGFAFKDSTHAYRAMDGALGDSVRAEIGAAGLYVHPRMWENGMRQVTSSTRPVRAVADLDGFKMRVPNGALWIDLFRSFGSAPTPINGGEVYTALQTHVVDGEENPLAAIATMRLFEVQKYLSITNHMWSAYHFLGNADAWKALPRDVQAVVERNLTAHALLQRADTQRKNDALAGQLAARGMTVSGADVGGFRAKLTAAGFYAKWKGAFGSRAWDLLERYAGKLA